MPLEPRFRLAERSPPEPAHLIRAHERKVHQMVFLDEDTFVTAGEDGQLLQIGIDGRIVRAFDGHEGRPVNCLTAIDRERFATGGDDGVVRVWNSDGSCEQAIEQHRHHYVRSVAARGRLLVSVAEDRTIAFWDLPDRALLRTEPLLENPSSVAVSGRSVVVATLDNTLSVFDPKTGEPRDPIYRSDSYVAHIGRLYMSMPNTSGIGHRNPPSRLLHLEDGTLLSASEELIAWAPLSHAQRTVRRFAWPIESIAVCAGGLWIASCDLQQIDMDGRLLGWLPPPDRRPSAVAVSPDDRWIAIAGEDGTIHIYGSDAIARDFDRHREPARNLVLSGDGALALTTDAENTTLVWSTATGEMLARVEEPSPNSSPTAFKDGGSFFSASHEPESTLTLRKIDGAAIKVLDLTGAARRITPHAIAPLPDGRLLVGSLSNDLHCWDRELADRSTFTGRTQQIREIHLASDGKTAVTLGYFSEVEPDPASFSLGDSSSKLQGWDLDRGELLWTISAQKPPPDPEKKLVLPYGFGFVAMCARGVLAQTGDAEDQVALRDLRTGAELWRTEVAGHPLAQSIDGETLELLVSRDEEPLMLCAIDVSAGRCLRSIELEASKAWSAVFIERAIAFAIEGVLHLFDRQTGALVQRIDQPHVQELAVRDRLLVATTRDGRIAAWRV